MDRERRFNYTILAFVGLPFRPGQSLWKLAWCILGVMTLALVACSGSGSVGGLVASKSVEYQGGKARPQALVGPPSGGAYFGANVNPSGVPTGDTSVLETETSQLESQISRPLAFHIQYRNWAKMLQIGSDPGILDDINHGRVPVISWTCADDATLDKNKNPLDLYEIQQGLANTDLANIKQQLLQLKYPDGTSYPVILRYFWEFNVNATPGANPNSNGNGGCFGPEETYPKEFIGAWDQIWLMLSGVLPRPNVSFDWNPNVSDPSYDDASYIDFGQFWPLRQYVDWIGADGYNKLGPGPDSGGDPIGFYSIFSGFVAEIEGDPKYSGEPLMIGETGSCQQYGTTFGVSQTAFLQSIPEYLNTSQLPFQAVDYFDAPGQYTYNGGHVCSWNFDSEGIQGFATMGVQQFFSPMVRE